MKIIPKLQMLWPFVCAIPLIAQPQIGGGVCTSATLKGNYSLTLTGRNYSTQSNFSDAAESVGTATFDGLNNVTFNLVTVSDSIASSSQPTPVTATMTGTYSISANCIGTVSISGTTTTYVLGAFNQGANYFLTGSNGIDSLNGSGNTMPASSCSNNTWNGTYSFNGNGYGVASGTINAIETFSGLITFDGTGNVTAVNWNLHTSGAATSSISGAGIYSIGSGCTATAQIKTSTGATYQFNFTIDAANGAYVMNAVTAGLMLSGSGRPL